MNDVHRITGFDNDDQKPTTHSGLKGFFFRHWDGEYSLARSYWVHYTGMSITVPIVFYMVGYWIGQTGFPRTAAAIHLVAALLFILLWIWLAKGTFSSANRHEERGGKRRWANIARFLIVIGAIRLVFEVATLKELVMPLWEVATATGSMEQIRTELAFDANRRTIVVSGLLNHGTAKELEALLAQHPAAEWIEFDSDGGLIQEGQQIAKLIKQRRLKTYVSAYCASSCTLAFLSGIERVARPDARIGFHTFRGPAIREQVLLKSALFTESEERRVYREAGIKPEFIDRIDATPVEDTLFPSHREMVDIGILTR